ncbi:MAG: hypothetical protein WCX88_04475 [Patescibacteria group bacterium]|jgi:hypothetical protein
MTKEERVQVLASKEPLQIANIQGDSTFVVFKYFGGSIYVLYIGDLNASNS